MDPDDNPPRSRPKRRFVPRVPQSSRRRQPPPPKPDQSDENREAARAHTLLNRFTANVARRGSTTEKKPPVQVALQANTSSTTIRSYGVPGQGGGGKLGGLDSKDSRSDNEQPTVPMAAENEGQPYMSDHGLSAPESEQDYIEPWDYKNSYYPTVLPWRRPFSGNPELLDEAEFGQAARNQEYNESAMNDAVELGLMDKNKEERMLLVKLPFDVPFVKHASSSRRGKEKVDSSWEHSKDANLESLPEGYMGKMLVYKSGAVKFKLGETLFNVMPGGKSEIPQDVAVINTKERHCCIVGALDNMRVAVSADVDFLLQSETDSGQDK